MADASSSSAKESKVMDDDDTIMGLDDIGDDAMVKLKSKEGKLFEVKKKAAIMSRLIRTAIENDKSKEAPVIELLHIESDIVQKVIDYVTYHSKTPPRTIEKPLVSTNLRDLVDDFDAKYADVDQDTMFKTLLAANYMHIQPLLLLMCAKVASLMKGKTPDEIKETFGIRKDCTPEEEEEVRKQYKDLLD